MSDWMILRVGRQFRGIRRRDDHSDSPDLDCCRRFGALAIAGPSRTSDETRDRRAEFRVAAASTAGASESPALAAENEGQPDGQAPPGSYARAAGQLFLPRSQLAP